MPHFELTVLLAFLLSALLSMTGKKTSSERLLRALYVFSSTILSVILSSWVMYFIET